MNFTLCRGNSLGDARNCCYPHQHVVTDEETLKETLIEAVSSDYVGALYVNNLRCCANFICSNVVIMDVDNTHSDNPEDWVTPERIAQVFSGVAFAIHYSRHHMKEKEGSSPRPKFHVLFPIEEITSAEIYAEYMRP